jgi:hypothetical protein
MFNFKMIKFILGLYVVFSIFFPGITLAQAQQTCDAESVWNGKECVANTVKYQLLAPLPCKGNELGCVNGELSTIDTGGPDALGKYLNIAINIAVGLAGVLAVLMIVMGGIEYMTSELANTKEDAKSRITNAIMGLVIALGAYALIYTINPNLVRLDTLNFKTAELKVTVEAVDIAQGCSGTNCGGYAKGGDWAAVGGTATALPPFVNVNRSGDCSKIGDQACTSTRGLNTGAVLATQQGCGCVLTITGGTESWLHNTGTSHKPGSSTVDLQMTTDLNNYIIKNGIPGKDARGFKIFVIGDVKYLPEKEGSTTASTGTHWHVYQ